MKKQEMIVEVANKAEVSQKVVKDVLVALEEVIDTVVEARDGVTICGIKVSTKEQAEQTRTHNFGENAGKEYTVPAKIVPTCKFLGSKKTKLSKEI